MIPADPPLAGWFWSWLLPALLFAVSLAATIALYRRFSRR